MLEIIQAIRLRDILDILIVSFIIYRVILIIKGTRAVQMLAGIVVLIVVYFGARQFELLTLYWLLSTFLSSIFIIIIIIFQRDIRRALTQMGQTPFTRIYEDTVASLDEIIAAAGILSRRKIGALIVIERETGLKDYMESSRLVDAKLTKELLVTIFHPSSPMHDGGVVVSNGRIMNSSCVLPLTRNPYISKQLGTRHRAAIGLSEETDAVIVVVSEETGRISIVQHGAITTDLDESTLKSRLDAIFTPKEYQTHLWKSWLSRQ